MIANYHTHTPRCHHAVGQERAYIEAALQNGLTVLGFADHAPMPFPNGHRSSFRMDCDQLDDYCATLSALKREYAHDIEILIGLESEYYPAVFPGFLKLIDGYPLDYLILGQHATKNEYDGAWSGSDAIQKSDVDDYTDQVIAGLKTGRFSYVAHPDLPTCGTPDIWQDALTRLCVAAKELNIPLEFNLLGFYEHRQYPNDRFWQIAAETGNTVILGFDAHDPDHFRRTDAVTQAQTYLHERGLTPLETLPLKPVY